MELGISETSICIFRREWVSVCFVHDTSLSWTLLFKPWRLWPVLFHSLQLFPNLPSLLPCPPLQASAPHSCSLPPHPLLICTISKPTTLYHSARGLPLTACRPFPRAQAPLAQPPHRISSPFSTLRLFFSCIWSSFLPS